ncbi:MAG: DUF1624 domain-containing protein [Planctomycetales bacterium]|nr:DUF1624 domain-containing protein [Planctomycetales bacterium]
MTKRLGSLDTWRGLAIILMILDHAVWIFADIRISVTTIRFVTRFCLPLFCILMGYFLAHQVRFNLRRYTHLILAALVINVGYFSRYHQLEILSSLLICATLYWLLFYCGVQNWFALTALAPVFYWIDPTSVWHQRPPYDFALFDYPLTVVMGFVAVGCILKQVGTRTALSVTIFYLLGIWWIGGHTGLVFAWGPVVVLCIDWGKKNPSQEIRSISWIGKHPLSIYVIQYFVLWCIQWFVNRNT